jgi:alkanesulfonate monooxygenase SsuD/methylene tetrahydromethanopterin reductase-like flavin-dependent oxidoreductase (luciferase family)
MVEFGFHCADDTSTFEEFRNMAITGEKLEYDFFTIADHLMILKQWYPENLKPLTAPFYECWTTLCALSTLTEKIRLGPTEIMNPFRIPSLVAKMGACLDNITQGRFELGIMEGFYEDEFKAYGIPFESFESRIKRLEEALQIIKMMWTEEAPSFRGDYYNIENAYCSPKPIQKPHPPICMLSRGGPTLKIAAKYCDTWRVQTPLPVNAYRSLNNEFEKICKELGRNPVEIKKSLWVGTLVEENEESYDQAIEKFEREGKGYLHESIDRYQRVRVHGTPEQCAEQLKMYIKEGVQQFTFYFIFENQLKGLKLFGERVIPILKKEFA